MAARYLWVSFQGCSRCEALAGLYDAEPPPRPHPECRCDVVRMQSEEDFEKVEKVTECYSVHVHEIRSPPDPSAPDGIFRVLYDYRVRCIDGSQHEDTATVDIPNDFFQDPETGEETFIIGWNYGLMETYEEIEVKFGPICCPSAPSS